MRDKTFSASHDRLIRKRIVEFLLIAAIILLAAWLRFYNLRSSPGWYSDEGSFINVAENLSAGKSQYFAIQGSTLLVGRLPLFMIVMSWLFNLFGTDILVGRSLAAACGILNILLVYLMVRKFSNFALAVTAALIYSIYPWAVFYNRMALTYNMLGFFGFLSVCSLWMALDQNSKRWMIICGISVSLALATDYLGIVFISLIILVVLIYRWKWLPFTLIWITAPIALILLPLAISDPSGLISDLRYTFLRVEIPPGFQIINIVLHYGELIRREIWIAIGLIGLFLIHDRRLRWMFIYICFVTILLVVRSLPPVGRNYHHLIHLFPYISIGIASLFIQAVQYLFADIDGALVNIWNRLLIIQVRGQAAIFRVTRATLFSMVVVVFLISPFIWMLTSDFVGISSSVYSFITKENDHNLADVRIVQETLSFLESNLSPADVVIASPQILWAVPALKADFAQTIAFNEGDAGVLQILDRNRFIYDCSTEAAKFVVLDPLVFDYATLLVPDLRKVIVEVKTWNLAYQTDGYLVYINPLYGKMR